MGIPELKSWFSPKIQVISGKKNAGLKGRQLCWAKYLA